MSTGRNLKHHVFSFLLFFMICGIVVAVIQFVNWLPLALQSDSLRRYGSVEEVKASFPDLRIYVPTYFPQTISWPPEHVFAQNKPFPWLLMKFKHRDSPEEALIITEFRSGQPDEQFQGEFEQVSEHLSYKLRGRPSLLEVGVCRNGEQCSRISWNEGEYRIVVFMTSSPVDLIRIAESMLH